MKKYCGNCGEEITEADIDNDAVICPECHWSCWLSECLPENYKSQGYFTLMEMKSNGERV